MARVPAGKLLRWIGPGAATFALLAVVRPPFTRWRLDRPSAGATAAPDPPADGPKFQRSRRPCKSAKDRRPLFFH